MPAHNHESHEQRESFERIAKFLEVVLERVKDRAEHLALPQSGALSVYIKPPRVILNSRIQSD